jgi:hypothetical protein
MAVAKRYQDELPNIKKKIENSYNYFRDNYKRFHEDKKFLGVTSLSDAEKAMLDNMQIPVMEFNTLEAYVSRQTGEFGKHEPSIKVEKEANVPSDALTPATIAVVEGSIRAALGDAAKNGFADSIIKDLLGGGFSAARIYTAYAPGMTFEQDIKFERANEPTLCYWDVNARLPHKGDGMYAGELFPKTVDDFRGEFGNGINIDTIKFSKSTNVGSFSWSLKDNDEDILLVADHYVKKFREKKIVQLVNGQVMTTDDYEQLLDHWQRMGMLAQPPAVKGKPRMYEIPMVCRYKLIDNQVLDYEETDYKSLPIVFFDGNSVFYRENGTGSAKQVTRSYIYHAKDQQRLINLSGQKIADKMQDNDAKLMIASESLNPKYLDGIVNNKKASAIITDSLKINPDGSVQELRPPTPMVTQPIAQEIVNVYMQGQSMMQNILGSYDASLGINDNQLSGTAIVEAATQSNATAMPYVMGYLQGLNQLSVIYIELMPLYYKTPRTLPIVMPDGKRSYVPINQPGGVSINYSHNALQVHVEAGVNFAIQKSRALSQIIMLCQASQLFAQFINQMGLEVLLDNLEIRGIDQLKQLAQQFMKELQEQQAKAKNMPNPLMLKAQAEQAKVQIAQGKLQLDQQMAQTDAQFRAAETINNANANTNDRLKIMLDAQQQGVDDSVQMNKARAEEYKSAVDLALKAADQHHQHGLAIHDQLHRHAKETAELINDTADIQNQIKQSNKPQPAGAEQNA